MKNLYFSLLMLSLLNIDSLSQLDHAVNKTLHPRYRGIPSKIEDTGLESNMLNMNILEDTYLNSRSLKKGFKSNRYKPSFIQADERQKYYFTYSTEGDSVTMVVEVWKLNSWVNEYRLTKTYNQNGEIETELNEKWSNGTWVNNQKSSYTYDDTGNLMFFLYKLWGNGAWVNSQQNFYTHDSTGNRLSYVAQSWNNSNGEWNNVFRGTYSYDSLGNRLSRFSESWSNNGWGNYLRETYTYDSIGRLTTDLIEGWAGLYWTNTSRFTYSYDSNGELFTVLEEYWMNNSWRKQYQTTYYYDTDGNRLQELMEIWGLNDWDNYSKSQLSYDAFGNCVLAEAFIWESGSWVSYAMNNDLYYNHMSDVITISGKRVTAEYTDITDIQADNLYLTSFSLYQNYPNPFNPETVIRFALPEAGYVKGVVYDILGREVTTLLNGEMNSGNHEVKFDAEGLTSGIYVFRLQAGQNSSNIKMILTK
jgi:hypothetical protein